VLDESTGDSHTVEFGLGLSAQDFVRSVLLCEADELTVLMDRADEGFSLGCDNRQTLVPDLARGRSATAPWSMHLVGEPSGGLQIIAGAAAGAAL
jgi:hypothetical protein